MNYVITAKQAQSIIDIACNDWKDRLASMWAKGIILQKHIRVNSDFYQEMRNACTDQQHILFDQIFGAQTNCKIGDCVITKGFSKSYDGRVLRIISIVSDELTNQRRYYFKPVDNGNYETYHYISECEIERLATEEEIKKASYPVKGTICVVWMNDSIDYKYIRIADGKGEFLTKVGNNGEEYLYGICALPWDNWEEVKSLDQFK